MTDFVVDLDLATSFMLVLARTSAWVIAAPVFSTKGLAPIARLAVAVALALFLTPLAPIEDVPADTGHFVVAVLVNIGIGLALGFLTGLILAAIEIAGSLADLFSGFSFGTLLDPVSGSQSAAFARLSTVVFLGLMFAMDGYRQLIAGFALSFQALPIDASPGLNENLPSILGSALSGVFVAALQIGAPLLGVLILTEVALAVATRFVPQANAVVVGLPVKALVALSAAGAMLATLPGHLSLLLDPALRLPGQVLLP